MTVKLNSGDLSFVLFAAVVGLTIVCIVATFKVTGYLQEKVCADTCGAQGYERVMDSCLCGR